jgi:uracil-DNA glycosylase family 4
VRRIFARRAEPSTVDANQEQRSNPFGMDESCENCPALCESRERVVHGYGPVDADFLFVGEAPGEGAEASGVPFDEDGEAGRVREILSELGLWAGEDEDGPVLVNTFLTYLTRCRDPERAPTDEEVGNCEPYLNAEIRMINPEILVPVGERALSELAREYTTTPAEEFDLREVHATTVRGRGFELVPMLGAGEMEDDDVAAFVDRFAELMGSDYRQTKGRRSR